MFSNFRSWRVRASLDRVKGEESRNFCVIAFGCSARPSAEREWLHLLQVASGFEKNGVPRTKDCPKTNVGGDELVRVVPLEFCR